jgi:hypothetical protein
MSETTPADPEISGTSTFDSAGGPELPGLEAEHIQDLVPDLRNLIFTREFHEKPESWFYLMSGCLPSSLNLLMPDHLHPVIHRKILSTYRIANGNRIVAKNLDEDFRDDINELLFIRRDLAVMFQDTDEITIYYPRGRYGDFISSLSRFVEAHSDERKEKFNLIVEASSGSLKLNPFRLKDYRVSIDTHYNDDLGPVHDFIVSRLDTYGDHGLVLLYGKPGTGKTTYIRYLSRILKKRVIYIPPQFSVNLTNDQFMDLMVRNPDSVMIIEDAENIITDRRKAENFSIPALLNISDGLLSYCLRTQVICTFNSDLSSIDPALLRKGRLIALYEFRELDRVKAARLAGELGLDREIGGPVSLADLFHGDMAGGGGYERPTIGFKR